MADPAPTISQAASALRTGATSSVALTRQALARITEHDATINAFVRIDGDAALQAAAEADTERRAGLDRGPFHGVPYALKDIYDAKGLPTLCQSHLRTGHVAAEDSAVAAAFRRAGAILLGKVATYEFALGGPGFDLPFPPARNPWNTQRSTGGSSSGSAAAVAAGYVAVSPGTCTTGSIRGPAAWCGAVGLKPTYGRVSKRGVFPLAWSLDHCGPLARTVEDAAFALHVMAGHDPADPASANVPVADYSAGLNAGVAGLRVGVPRHFFETSTWLHEDARRGIDDALAALADQGAEVADVTLPAYELFMACGRVIMTAEAHAIHREDLRTRYEAYGVVAARRFSIGAAIEAADYLDAQRVRTLLTQAVDSALHRYDVLVTAISLDTAPPLVDDSPAVAAPLQSSPFNVTGHPALSVPVGLGRDGLPLAVQIIGRRFDEATVLHVGKALEASLGWGKVPLPF